MYFVDTGPSWSVHKGRRIKVIHAYMLNLYKNNPRKVQNAQSLQNNLSKIKVYA